MAHISPTQRQHFDMPTTQFESCEKRASSRIVSNDDRKGSNRADGFILAVFPRLLKVVLVATT